MITPLAARRGLITSLARGIQRESAAVSWWLAGGISAANCVAAYQAKGAADYATSKINLANPGTYNCADGTAYPSWDGTGGWTFGSNRFLIPGITPTKAMVYAIRISDYIDTWWLGLFGTYNNAGNVTYIGIFPVAGTLHVCNYTKKSTGAGAGSNPGTATLIVNEYDFYVDGSLICSLSSNITQETTDYYIGGFHRIGYSVYRAGNFKCQAFANYDSKLTVEQVSALTTAMNAL